MELLLWDYHLFRSFHNFIFLYLPPNFFFFISLRKKQFHQNFTKKIQKFYTDEKMSLPLERKKVLIIRPKTIGKILGSLTNKIRRKKYAKEDRLFSSSTSMVKIKAWFRREQNANSSMVDIKVDSNVVKSKCFYDYILSLDLISRIDMSSRTSGQRKVAEITFKVLCFM